MRVTIISIFAFLAYLSLASACNSFCTMEYAPVCCSPVGLTGPSKQFSNECQLNNYNCANPTDQYQIATRAECVIEENQCNNICTMEYVPVCGSSIGHAGTTMQFSNECELNNYNCANPTDQYQISSRTECATEENQCNTICTMEYAPVCCLPIGRRGPRKQFRNRCELDNYNCANPTNQYYVRRRTECY